MESTLPLQLGLKVDHRGEYYKIIDYHREPNSVIIYIIQSYATGKERYLEQPKMYACTYRGAKLKNYRICHNQNRNNSIHEYNDNPC